MSEQKKDYWKAQNLKRVNVGISRALIGKFRGIRNELGFKNDDHMLEYLLDVEESNRKEGNVVKYDACEKCGAPINVELDSYNGITHQHLDSKSNCFGCIKTRYRVKNKVELSTITKISQQMQVEQKDPSNQPEQKDQIKEHIPEIRF